MELRRTIAAYLPLLFSVGALLIVIGLLIRLMANTASMKVTGNKTITYGVVAILLALALWGIMRVIEAWESGVIESIGT